MRDREAVLLLLLLAAEGRRGGRARDRLGDLVGSVGNRVLEVSDVDAVLERVDVDAVLGRVDVEALLGRIDVDGLLDRIDVNRLLDRVDVDGLLARVDVGAVADRLDLDRLLARVDVEGLVRRAGIPELIADSTGQVAGSALDLGRRQLVGLDVALGRLAHRLLGRTPGTYPRGPASLVAAGDGQVAAPALSRSRAKARTEVSGYYAGPVSRSLAFAGDLSAATLLFTGGALVASWVVATVFGASFTATQRSGPVWAALFTAWLALYWWGSTALAGRTPVMLVAGLRVVARDGGPVPAGRALVRTLVLPLSVVAFGLGAVGILVDRERRALHDLVAGCTVVYDWGGRPAELPSPLGRWLASRTEEAAPSSG